MEVCNEAFHDDVTPGDFKVENDVGENDSDRAENACTFCDTMDPIRNGDTGLQSTFVGAEDRVYVCIAEGRSFPVALDVAAGVGRKVFCEFASVTGLRLLNKVVPPNRPWSVVVDSFGKSLGT